MTVTLFTPHPLKQGPFQQATTLPATSQPVVILIGLPWLRNKTLHFFLLTLWGFPQLPSSFLTCPWIKNLRFRPLPNPLNLNSCINLPPIALIKQDVQLVNSGCLFLLIFQENEKQIARRPSRPFQGLKWGWSSYCSWGTSYFSWQ